MLFAVHVAVIYRRSSYSAVSNSAVFDIVWFIIRTNLSKVLNIVRFLKVKV